jgi:hypothetical protein
MKLVNNLYYEVLYAHFKYVVHYKPEDTLTFQENCFISDGYRFPIHFFDWFDVINAKEESEALLLLKRHYQEMKSKFRELPKLEDVDEPTAIYYEFWGIKLALKEIIVPHPDGNTSSICYKYHFYRIGSLLKFVFTTNSVKRAILFNDKLKTRTTKIVEGLFPVVRNYSNEASNVEEDTQSNLDNEVEELNPFTEKMTTLRSCLFVLYLLKGLGIDYTKESLTVVARLVSLSLGKEIPINVNGNVKIEHSYIYKTLKKLRKLPDEKLQQDYIAVKELFDWAAKHFNAPQLIEMSKLLEIKIKQ